ncbi:MAG: hypothetical protein HYR94_06285 [Chloroflexi bacterium]|nr:hypothetical protein [Chloroflexota bacterium]
MTECGIALRKLGSQAKSMEEAANKMVRYIYEHFVDRQTDQRACALVRFYKTHPYQELDPQLRHFADGILGNRSKPPKMKCLTLLATVGDRPEWNSRADSTGHQAIPLLDLAQTSFNVFHVAEAEGSPYVPAQEEFVIPCGIKSVLSFGGMLPSGHLFAIILFSKTPITRVTADMFKTLALSVKMAVLSFNEEAIFNSSSN